MGHGANSIAAIMGRVGRCLEATTTTMGATRDGDMPIGSRGTGIKDRQDGDIITLIGVGITRR
jgi:hypothetical protein